MAEFTSVNKVDIDENEVIEYISGNYYPEDVFEYKELEEWALENGFMKNEAISQETTESEKLW